jgi:hypothetical protein
LLRAFQFPPMKPFPGYAVRDSPDRINIADASEVLK